MLTTKEIRVLQLRQQGLTQVAIAKQLRISQAAISQFEQNARQKIKDAQEILRVAELLKIRDEDPLAEVLNDLRKRGGRR